MCKWKLVTVSALNARRGARNTWRLKWEEQLREGVLHRDAIERLLGDNEEQREEDHVEQRHDGESPVTPSSVFHPFTEIGVEVAHVVCGKWWRDSVRAAALTGCNAAHRGAGGVALTTCTIERCGEVDAVREREHRLEDKLVVEKDRDRRQQKQQPPEKPKENVQ